MYGDDGSGSAITKTTVTPWTPQGDHLKLGFNRADDIYKENIKNGMPAWNNAGTAALNRMDTIARGDNPFMQPAQNAVTGVASGQNGIGTGTMFNQLYNRPGVDEGNFQNAYANPGINTGDMFNSIYGDTTGSPGMLSQGLFGAVGQGDLLSKRGSPGGYSPPNWDSARGGPYMGDRPPPNWDSASGRPYMGELQSAPGGDPNYSQTDQRQRPPGDEDRDFAVTANPYRQAALNDAMKQTGNQIKASMSGAGRYGSGAYGEAMARGLGGVASQALMSGYDTDMAQMLQARQAASNENIALQGLGLSAAQGATGVQGQNAANRLSAAQGLAGVQGQNAATQMEAAKGRTGVEGQNIANQMQAAGMAPAMSDFRYSDADRLAQVGGAQDTRNQAEQNFSSDQLRNYMSMLGSVPGSAGVSATTGEGQSGWLNALGGAATGAGVGSMFAPGIGTAIGGALGGLGGWLFG